MDRPRHGTKAPPRLMARVAVLGLSRRRPMAAAVAAIGSALPATPPVSTTRSTGGTIGADYKVNPNIADRRAFNYTNPIASLNGGTGQHQSRQLPDRRLCLASPTRISLTDVVATYGHHVYRIDRPGVIDTIRGRHQRQHLHRRRQIGLSVRCRRGQGRPAGGLVYETPTSIRTPRPVIPSSPRRSHGRGSKG